MRSERLGIVVLNWNGLAVLPACLNSLDEATSDCRAAVRKLVVDNASTDGSVDMLRKDFTDWELIETGENLLYAGGMNAGISRCLEEGDDFILVLNNDIEVERDFISPLLARLRDVVGLGAVSPRIHFLNPPDRIWFAGGRVGRLSLVSSHLGIRQRPARRFLSACDSEYLTGCAILGRSAFWRDTGGFDPSFGLYAEDVDLALRARQSGWRLGYVPESLIYHSVGFASGGAHGWSKLVAQTRATARLIRRHQSALLRPLSWAAWLMVGSRRLFLALWLSLMNRTRGEGAR